MSLLNIIQIVIQIQSPQTGAKVIMLVSAKTAMLTPVRCCGVKGINKYIFLCCYLLKIT